MLVYHEHFVPAPPAAPIQMIRTWLRICPGVWVLVGYQKEAPDA